MSVAVVGRGGLDEVVASCRRALVTCMALDLSTRSRPAGTSGSLDPSKSMAFLRVLHHDGRADDVSCHSDV
jgi:hypothetical protein